MAITRKTIQINLLPTQDDFVFSTRKEVMFSSGYGAGKSMAGCLAVVRQAIIPGNVTVIARKTLTSLKRSTVLTLTSGTNPVLPPGSFTYVKSESRIDIVNGGCIYLMGLDDETRVRSMNIGAVFIDEMSELSEDEYKELYYRLRLEQGSRQMWSATNPAGPSHWAYKRFFLDNNPERQVITASSLDNPHLPEDYKKSLMEMDGGLRQRYVEGLWVALDDLVFPNFTREKNVRNLSNAEKDEEYLLGIDWGQTHPSALVLVGKTRDRIRVLGEWVKCDPSINTLIEIVRVTAEKYPGLSILYDPSAKQIANELANINVKCQKANNDVSVGIARMRTKLDKRNDMPDLVVDSRCTNTIREFESYQYKPGSEAVKKINDDCLDALRYCINECEDVKGMYIHPTVEPVTKALEDEDEEIELENESAGIMSNGMDFTDNH